MKFRLVEENALNDPEVQETVEELPEEEQDIVEVILDRVNFKPIDNPNEIMKALDKSLDISIDALDLGRDTAGAAANLLLVGGAGTGKSSVVRKWAEKRNINLIQKSAGAMDKSDMGGAVARAVDAQGANTNKMTRLTNSEFESLQEPGSVLFLDELNRADPEIVGSLLTLILDHKVPDNYSKGGMQNLKGFLFTVAAINPADEDTYEGTHEFDNALLDRFRQISVKVDIPQYRRHLLDELQSNLEIFKKKAEKHPERYNEKVKQTLGKISLADTILSDPMFEFDGIEDEKEAREVTREGGLLQNKILSPRGFSAVIRACDGTKESLLEVWPDYCNINRLEMIENILEDYVDVDDKANDALKYKDGLDPAEDIFSSNEWDKYNLDDALDA